MDAHPRDELQAWLDGRLPEARRREVERHLATCEECREELEAVGAVRDGLGSAFPGAPAGLARKVNARLDAEDAASRHRSTPPLWLPLAAAVVLVAVAVGVPIALRGPEDIVALARGTVAESAVPTLEAETVGMRPDELEAWFTAEGLPFPARVFDFGGMAFELVGGRFGSFAGEPSAVYVYRGPDGKTIVCQMYLGRIPPSPSDGEVRVRGDGVEFRTVRRDGAVLVFWQEGDVACVLGSEDLDEETVQAFADAKAIRV